MDHPLDLVLRARRTHVPKATSRPVDDSLLSLQFEVTEFVDHAPHAPPQELARQWAELSVTLGRELRQHGYAKQLMDVTIGPPIDHAAIDVLRLACVASFSTSDTDVFDLLAARLEVVLTIEAYERDRFVNSLKNVLRRLTMFHC
jgi:hypothetical protein